MRRLFPASTFVAPSLPRADKDLVRLVVAEAPGSEEALVGEPLVGGSGRIFNKLLEATGIDRSGLTITNCIQCQPPDNVFPTDAAARKYISKEDANSAVNQCYKNHVLPLLRGRDWKRVDLLGDKPLRIVGKQSGGIFTRRGSPLSIGRGEDKVPLRGLATLHPAYLMRDQVYLKVAANDLVKSLVEPPEHYLPFPSIEDVRNFTATEFAFDIETKGWSKEIECVGLSAEKYKALCVPFRGEYLVELKRIFSNSTKLIGQNIIQFDIPILFPALGLEWSS